MDALLQLRSAIDKIHTTALAAERIRRNLHLSDPDAEDHIRRLILSEDCRAYRQGKNIYCESCGVRITLHAGSYTVITAHPVR